MAGNGYIKLYRKLQNNFLWSTEPYDRGHAWVDMIIRANRLPADITEQVDGQYHTIHVERGEFLTSSKTLAGTWNWSRSKVNRYITLLEKSGMIVKKRTPHGMLIKLVNYAKYQDEKFGRDTSLDTSLDTTVESSVDTSLEHKQEVNTREYREVEEGEGFRAFDGTQPRQAENCWNSGNGSSGNRQNGNYNKSSNKADYYVPKSTDEIPWYVHFNVYHITGEKACTTDVWNKPVIMDKFRDNPKGACEFYARLKDGAEHPERYKDVAVSMKVDKHDDE